MPKILVVDDEISIVKVIEQALVKEGMDVLYATEGDHVMNVYQKDRPDLVILDLMLPKVDGFTLCRRIREISDVPIIILSAKGDVVDKSVGFNLGADDYLTKPFSPQELIMRVKAVLRRFQGHLHSKEEVITLDQIKINKETRKVWVRGNEISFTPKEFDILYLLCSQPGRVFTREQMVLSVWGDPYIDEANNIPVYIRKLRQKIELDAAKPKILETVWGVGYRIAT